MLSIPEIIHSLVNWRYGVDEETVLNDGVPPVGRRKSIAGQLRLAINAMKAQAFADFNGKVDYRSLSASNAYTDYRLVSRRLQLYDPSQLETVEEQLAFWINLYNALLIDAVIVFGVQETVNEVPGFFWKTAYCINGQRFSTFDIEYGILRANIGHPGIPGPHFPAGDPRREFSLESLDPRIHFALVCASRSCPPIAIYTAEDIDQQLNLAASSFVNGGGVEIDRENNEVRLSKIFQWYASDFGGPTLGLGNMLPVVDFFAPFLSNDEDRAFLKNEKYKVKYTPYDWTLNV